MFHFYTPYTPYKNQKTPWISDASLGECVGGREVEHWLEMD